jgi:two-component system CheB/CheR fusion protein
MESRRSKKKTDRPISTRPPASPAEIPDEPGPAISPGAGFPIVGIGASAGGLAAFEAFFTAMPAVKDPGMAFVLVQHLAPNTKSMLTDLIKHYTRMDVLEVKDGMTVRPGCVYIIPPNRDMALINGTLQLLEPVDPRGRRLPIDFFFRSLANDQHERAIGIILSGAGRDGSLGVRAIKGEGGMVMVQNPESTEYDGMPRSAIATGLVDFILPLAELPSRLVSYVTHAFGKLPHKIADLTYSGGGDALKKILLLLRSQTGHDFSGYKIKTISRRIERRMAVHQIDRLDAFVSYLQHNPMDIEELFRDLLIGVTSFFRDPEAFAALETQAIPQLFADKPSGSTIRIWVPGCSTGEEAYSIAILLKEQMEALKQNFQVQMFATDIDCRAIESARAAVYSAGIAADVPPERLARFFSRESDGGAYSINKSLRELLVFSEQDVIRDPPFSKLDLISCRNVLIYMNKELQNKLISLFHYALNPGGKLFLGTSETVGEFSDAFFKVIDSKEKLYQREKNGHKTPWQTAIGMGRPQRANAGLAFRPPGMPTLDGRIQLRELVEGALFEHCALVGALVDGRGEILFLHGRTGMYLEPAPGEAGMNILKMAREGLREELTGALRKAAAQPGPVRRPGLRVKTNGEFSLVDLTVRPMAARPDTPGEPALFLVVLEETPATAPLEKPVGQAADDARIGELTQDRLAKEEYVQAMKAELETANQELLSSYEEMQSVNEELQSTNEELETSKEELQSLNEELGTVNSELQQNVADLSQINNDMSNLLANTGAGILFVDRQQKIKLFTPAVTPVINLIPTDVGRPVGQIASNLAGYDRLVADVQQVLENLTPVEVEVRARTGAWYLLRVRPYRTLNNVIEGAVITFTEITDMKKAQALLQESEAQRRLAVVVRDAHAAITVQDLTGRIMAWNPAATKLYGWSEAEALAMNIQVMQPGDRRAEERTMARHLAQSKVLEPYRSQRIAKDGKIIDVLLTATALINQAGDVYAVATTEWEIDSKTGGLPLVARTGNHV